MIDVKVTKRAFVIAYQWAYGTSKKEAEHIWSIATYDYKMAIIQGFECHCKKLFYYD